MKLMVGAPLLQDRSEFKLVPPGVSTNLCQGCEKFYPEVRNPDAYGSKRLTVCPHCQEDYVYPEKRVFIHPDSWNMLDANSAKDSLWFHATTLPAWGSVILQDRMGIPLVHLGTKQASWDIAEQHKRNYQVKDIYMYTLRLKRDIVVHDSFLQDTNQWDSYAEDNDWFCQDTVYRYVNDFEAPGSISLLAPADTFDVVEEEKV